MANKVFQLITAVSIIFMWMRTEAQFKIEAQYVTYRDSVYKFYMHYPSSWKYQKQTGTVLSFANEQSLGNKISDNVNLVIVKNDNTKTDQYLKILDSAYSSQLESYKKIGSANVLLDNINSIELTYQFVYNKILIRDIVFVMVKKKYVYIFTCTSESNRFDQQLSTFKSIVMSFHLQN